MNTSGRWELATALRHSLSEGLEPWAEAGFAEGFEFHSLKKVVDLVGFMNFKSRFLPVAAYGLHCVDRLLLIWFGWSSFNCAEITSLE